MSKVSLTMAIALAPFCLPDFPELFVERSHLRRIPESAMTARLHGSQNDVSVIGRAETRGAAFDAIMTEPCCA